MFGCVFCFVFTGLGIIINLGDVVYKKNNVNLGYLSFAIIYIFFKVWFSANRKQKKYFNMIVHVWFDSFLNFFIVMFCLLPTTNIKRINLE